VNCVLGLARSDVNVVSKAMVTSVSPTIGSLEGGLVVTIYGSGFFGDTSVTIGNSECEVHMNKHGKSERQVVPELLWPLKSGC